MIVNPKTNRPAVMPSKILMYGGAVNETLIKMVAKAKEEYLKRL